MPENENAASAEGGSPPTTPTTTSGATPSTEGTEPARATDGRFEPAQWRYPADYPITHLRGKTADEAARVTDQLYQELIRGGQMSAPQQSPYGQQSQSQAPATPQLQPPTEEDWLNDPRTAYQQQAAYDRATNIDPMLQQQAAAMGQQARELVRMADPTAFSRWGPEIDVLINQIPPVSRTVDNIKKVVGMVKADHLDELAEERAKARLEQMAASQGFRSDGSPGAPSTQVANAVDFDKAGLPDNYRRTLARHNVTPSTLDEFLRATECKTRGISLEQARKEWLEKANKGDIITEEAVRL